MVEKVKADAVLASPEDIQKLLNAKEKVIERLRELMKVAHTGEEMPDDLQKAGRALTEALHEHDKLIGIV